MANARTKQDLNPGLLSVCFLHSSPHSNAGVAGGQGSRLKSDGEKWGRSLRCCRGTKVKAMQQLQSLASNLLEIDKPLPLLPLQAPSFFTCFTFLVYDSRGSGK